MGMSIENSIRLLEDYHKWEKQYGIFGSGVDDATNKLLEVAKKYQQIQEIVNSKTTRLSYEEGFRQIKEVVEDGKID